MILVLHKHCMARKLYKDGMVWYGMVWSDMVWYGLHVMHTNTIIFITYKLLPMFTNQHKYNTYVHKIE